MTDILFLPRARSPLPALILFLALVALGCRTTQFPENPEEHRLYEELQAAGDEYYFNLRAGVASRVMGIMPVSAAREAAEQIRRRWSEIDRIDDADRLIEYLEANGLSEVGGRIEATLTANRNDPPPDGIDVLAQVAAVKQGLVDAVIELGAE